MSIYAASKNLNLPTRREPGNSKQMPALSISCAINKTRKDEVQVTRRLSQEFDSQHTTTTTALKYGDISTTGGAIIQPGPLHGAGGLRHVDSSRDLTPAIKRLIFPYQRRHDNLGAPCQCPVMPPALGLVLIIIHKAITCLFLRAQNPIERHLVSMLGGRWQHLRVT